VTDLALSVAVGTSQQLRRVHHAALPLRLDCGYVSRTTPPCHATQIIAPIGQTPVITLATANQQKKGPTPQTREIGPQTPKNFRLASSVAAGAVAHSSVAGCSCAWWPVGFRRLLSRVSWMERCIGFGSGWCGRVGVGGTIAQQNPIK